MSRLEKKLEELGYKLREGFKCTYTKGIGYCILKIYYDGTILDGFADINYQYLYTIEKQHIDKAEKLLQKDLKILKECENNEN